MWFVAERKFDAILHRSTRATLRLPYYHLAMRYLPFDERLKKLGTLTYHDRLTLARCMTIIKIQKGALDTNRRGQLMAARSAVNRGVRHARPFNIPLEHKTCLSRLMNTYNKMNHVIDLTKAINTNKYKIKKYLMTNQFNVAQNAI